MTYSNLRSGNKDVDDYIEALENELRTYQASNSRKLLRSIDNMAGKLSKDMDLIAAEQKNPDDTEVELSGKIVDTYLKMVDKCEKIENFIKVAEGLKEEKSKDGEITTITEHTTITTEPINKFEEVEKKIKAKLKH